MKSWCDEQKKKKLPNEKFGCLFISIMDIIKLWSVRHANWNIFSCYRYANLFVNNQIYRLKGTLTNGVEGRCDAFPSCTSFTPTLTEDHNVIHKTALDSHYNSYTPFLSILHLKCFYKFTLSSTFVRSPVVAPQFGFASWCRYLWSHSVDRTLTVTYSIRSPIKLTTVVYLLKMCLGCSSLVNL